METVLGRRTFERRLYGAAAVVFALLILAGFGRTYYLKLVFGTPPLPALVHVHGLLMTAWVALFATQVWLISARQVRAHQRLGYAAIGLASAIILTGIPTALRAAKYGSPSFPPGVSPLGFLVVPLTDLVMFAVFFGAAIAWRKRPAAHKALMLLTALNFLPPALARIPIPALHLVGPPYFFGVPTVLAIACLVLDTRRQGRVNRVLAGGAALLVASYVARLAVMPTSAWLAVAERLTSFV